jgi:hypothetical protein
MTRDLEWHENKKLRRMEVAAPDLLAALERIAEIATSQRRLAVNMNAIEHIAREAIANATREP